MKSDQTRLWWQKRLYIFIEYYRIVHNITRIYIYGETDAYKELLKDYITAGIVQYIDWPYMFDLGDGDIRAGIERARNMLGKPVPGRSDKFLNLILHRRLQMKLLWRVRAERFRWNINVDFDEFFVTEYDANSDNQKVAHLLDRVERLFPISCSLYFERRNLGNGLRKDSKTYHYWQNKEKVGRESGMNNWGIKTIVRPDFVLQMEVHNSLCLPSKEVNGENSRWHNLLKNTIVDFGRLKSMDLKRIGSLEFVLGNNTALSHWDYKEMMKKAVFIHGLVSSIEYLLRGASGEETERDKRGLPVMSTENSSWNDIRDQYASIISNYMAPGIDGSKFYNGTLESLQ